jgi:hypothetical protein
VDFTAKEWILPPRRTKASNTAVVLHAKGFVGGYALLTDAMPPDANLADAIH